MADNKHIVVCGGGVIGVCTTYFLAKKSLFVTLVEQSSIACAVSGKAGGFLALDMCDNGPVSALARASFNLHRLLSEELDGPRFYGYRPLTALCVSVTESEDVEGEADQSVTSWVDDPARMAHTIGNTETTSQVHPQLFARTLIAKTTSEYGVEVVIGKLESSDVEGGKATAVVLDGGRKIVCDYVVLALGPWSGKLSILSSIFSVYGLKVHSIVLEPKDRDAITPHCLFLSYYPAEGSKPFGS